MSTPSSKTYLQKVLASDSEPSAQSEISYLREVLSTSGVRTITQANIDRMDAMYTQLSERIEKGEKVKMIDCEIHSNDAIINCIDRFETLSKLFLQQLLPAIDAYCRELDTKSAAISGEHSAQSAQYSEFQRAYICSKAFKGFSYSQYTGHPDAEIDYSNTCQQYSEELRALNMRLAEIQTHKANAKHLADMINSA